MSNKEEAKYETNSKHIRSIFKNESDKKTYLTNIFQNNKDATLHYLSNVIYQNNYRISNKTLIKIQPSYYEMQLLYLSLNKLFDNSTGSLPALRSALQNNKIFKTPLESMKIIHIYNDIMYIKDPSTSYKDLITLYHYILHPLVIKYNLFNLCSNISQSNPKHISNKYDIINKPQSLINTNPLKYKSIFSPNCIINTSCPRDCHLCKSKEQQICLICGSNRKPNESYKFKCCSDCNQYNSSQKQQIQNDIYSLIRLSDNTKCISFISDCFLFSINFINSNFNDIKCCPKMLMTSEWYTAAQQEQRRYKINDFYAKLSDLHKIIEYNSSFKLFFVNTQTQYGENDDNAHSIGLQFDQNNNMIIMDSNCWYSDKQLCRHTLLTILTNVDNNFLKQYTIIYCCYGVNTYSTFINTQYVLNFANRFVGGHCPGLSCYHVINSAIYYKNSNNFINKLYDLNNIIFKEIFANPLITHFANTPLRTFDIWYLGNEKQWVDFMQMNNNKSMKNKYIKEYERM